MPDDLTPLQPLDAPETVANGLDEASVEDEALPGLPDEDLSVQGMETVPAFDVPAAPSPADLLHRAALSSGPDGAQPTPVDSSYIDDDPSLWDDPAALRELRFLTRCGVLVAVTGVWILFYFLSGRREAHPALWLPTLWTSVVTFCGLMGLWVYGFFATLRRGAYLWLVLGAVMPLVYAVWAEILLVRIRRHRQMT